MNAWYPLGYSAMQAKLWDWKTSDMRVALLRAPYVFDPAHEFVLQLASFINRRSSALKSKTVSAQGVLDAKDIAFGPVSAAPSNALLVYQHTGDDRTSRCVFYIDEVQGLPMAVANTVNVKWSDQAMRIAASQIVAAASAQAEDKPGFIDRLLD